jgi:tetratricopeptide (TPR) repeat protein
MSISVKKYRRRLYNKIKELEAEADNEKKIKLQKELEIIFGKIPESRRIEKDYYIAGLGSYKLCKLVNAIEYFSRALNLYPGYNMARLYLAHCFQDEKEYGEALINYLKVNQTELKNNFPVWRYVKLLEQIGYCFYLTDEVQKGIEYFNNVLYYYERFRETELAYPSEMLSCLPDDHHLKKEIMKLIAN